jgi:hypothetical protein
MRRTIIGMATAALWRWLRVWRMQAACLGPSSM